MSRELHGVTTTGSTVRAGGEAVDAGAGLVLAVAGLAGLIVAL
jgi:hypothetical protein